MARLFHTKITDLSALSYSNKKEEKRYIKADDMVLLTDKLNNYKSTMSELYGCLEMATIKANNVVSGNWSFKNPPILFNNTYLPEAVIATALVKPDVLVSKETVDGVYEWYLGILNDLSSFLYNKPRLVSYIGMHLITSLDTEEKVINIYGGVKWVQLHTCAFIAGANPDDEPGKGKYAVNDICNLFNSDYTLKAPQGALPKHNHKLSGSVSGNSTKVSYMGYDSWGPESPNFGKHGGKTFAVNISTPARGGCGTSVSVSLNTNSVIYGEDAKEAINNRPKYQCFYIWKRIA